MIKLSNRNSFWKIPSLTMIVSNAQAAISTDYKMMCIIRVNPHGMKVGMDAFGFICWDHRCWIKIDTTIITNRQRLIYIVKSIGIFCIYCKVLKIKGTVIGESWIVIDHFPMYTSIFTSIQSVFFSFYFCIHSIRIGRCYSKPNSS